ncbi:hypothetical protein KUTeg_009530 [Tegillarca granosa]|uniref:Cytochrome P450 n=1 Tax=Tegillarca granosa TaxID=220873 RepID=A0ABQ9F444_TEGGR|nr:hypothetical protein KUTeg_009530 [Tegillarca granosa]
MNITDYSFSILARNGNRCCFTLGITSEYFTLLFFYLTIFICNLNHQSYVYYEIFIIVVFFPPSGIIWSNGLQWKKLRRFSLQTMRDFGVGKKSLEDVIQQEMTGVLEQIELQKGNGFKLKHMLSTAVSNVIHSIVFGFSYKVPLSKK